MHLAAWKWFRVHARSNARHVVANVASPGYVAQQCVHVSSRLMTKLPIV